MTTSSNLRPQDIILSHDCGEWLVRVSNFIDDLLVKYYKQPPYYKQKTKEDLIGSLVIGLAPHTSAGVLGRVIGFYPCFGRLRSPVLPRGKATKPVTVMKTASCFFRRALELLVVVSP